eukprot:CAMPEP_0169253258 /NCGR_PEP_ID=MMETSP1016-20121227/38505_1 /TAXON_ID=342587 /ORGANISM="Karlodinium micrum, Strain CCMP2283" /LENGTH=278 /DNA_ID=CAMNT_0009334559 /DNA_START=90 /DNA_END=926 /DNA_ORIENTATION=-
MVVGTEKMPESGTLLQHLTVIDHPCLSDLTAVIEINLVRRIGETFKIAKLERPTDAVKNCAFLSRRGFKSIFPEANLEHDCNRRTQPLTDKDHKIDPYYIEVKGKRLRVAVMQNIPEGCLSVMAPVRSLLEVEVGDDVIAHPADIVGLSVVSECVFEFSHHLFPDFKSVRNALMDRFGQPLFPRLPLVLELPRPKSASIQLDVKTLLASDGSQLQMGILTAETRVRFERGPADPVATYVVPQPMDNAPMMNPYMTGGYWAYPTTSHWYAYQNNVPFSQ